VRAGVLSTPELSGVLEGITRDTVMTLARDRGIAVVERKISRDEIYCADEAFFTGTAAEITPIRELDRRPIGSGEPGPITRLTQKDYISLVRGENSARLDWLDQIVPAQSRPAR